jgi:hypothetical protein
MSAETAVTAWQASRPYIVRHFVLPGSAGALAGVAGVGGLLWCDVGGLGSLIGASGDGWMAVALLCIGFAVTFGSAAIGASVMAIGRE